MNLPNCQEAYVPPAKLISYLLNHDHPQNKGKARFYTLIGYDYTNANELQNALLRLACEGDVIDEQSNKEGIKYIVVGFIKGINGRQYTLKTVWVAEFPDNRPRLITAYPN